MAFTVNDFTNGKNVIKSNTNSILSISGSDFPASSTSDYVQNGLAFHVDAINNLGTGDTNHDKYTSVWYDLVGKNNLIISGGAANTATWGANSYFVGTSNVQMYKEKPIDLPIGSADRTMEFVAKNPSTITINNDNAISYGGYGTWSDNHMYCYSLYKQNATSNKQLLIPNPYGIGNQATYSINIQNESAFTTPNLNMTIQGTYAGAVTPVANKVHAYVNNIEKALDIYKGTTPTGTPGVLNTQINNADSFLIIGGEKLNDSDHSLQGYHIMSMRIYNRVLSSAELTANYQQDQIRFLNLPTIEINGKIYDSVYISDVNTLSFSLDEAGLPEGDYTVIVHFNGSSYTLPTKLKVINISDKHVYYKKDSKLEQINIKLNNNIYRIDSTFKTSV